MSKGTVIAASIAGCVHVAGGVHFLSLAQDEGYGTVFLGPAVSIDNVIAAIREHAPSIVSLGYRLTPENAVTAVRELIEKSKTLTAQPVWVFGCTPPVADAVRPLGFFDVIFDGMDDIDDSITFLRTGKLPESGGAEYYANDVVSRILQKSPYPLLRHHFGLPSYDDTLRGVAEIAESRVLDVISLGPDQNTQQYFFKPDKRDKSQDGAGGVPIRSADELRQLKKASQRGNYPLMRCYSGTDDVIRLADVLTETIQNAWCAVPLCWYNELDGRGTRPLEASIREAQELIAHSGRSGVPVEVNEPHHWGLRDAHDTISLVMAYISAYNAKKYGARDYIAQYMFNIPSSLSFSMDLAKVLAQIELVESLAARDFHIYRQTRAGLPLLSGDMDVAKGQLAATTALQMSVAPHIIHVVGYSEAQSAATPEVVTESCKIVRGVIRTTLHGNADATHDPVVIARRDELISEAKYLLDFITGVYSGDSADPLADAAVLSDCIKRGILDAPHIKKGGEFIGTLQTRVIDGKCLAYDESAHCVIDERTRLAALAAVRRLP